MIMPTRSGVVVTLLIVVNMTLLVLLGYQWLNLDFEVELNESVDAVQESNDLPLTTKKSFAKLTISDYAAVTSRPLFNTDRLPLPENADGEGEGKEQFSLLGVVLTSQQQVAIIYSKTQKQPVKTQLWDWVDGWRLIAVKPKQVVLRKGNRTLEVQLQPNAKTESEQTVNQGANRLQ